MNQKQSERLVLAWEAIAKALEGLRDEAKKAGERYWPEQREQKESIVTRIPNTEDEAKRNLGFSDAPIKDRIERGDWLDLGPVEDDDEFIGEREREWRRTHPQEPPQAKEQNASPEGPGPGTEDKGGTRARKTKSKA